MVINTNLTVIAVFALIMEFLLICWITKIVKNSTNLSVKDTRFYPFVILLAVAMYTSIYFEVYKENVLDAFLNSLAPSLKVVGLSFEIEIANALKSVDTMMMIAYYVLSLTCLYGFISLFIVLVKITVSNWFRIKRAKNGGNYFSKSERIIVDSVYSYNDTTKRYLENLTAEEKKRTIVYINSIKAKHNKKEIKQLKSYYYGLGVAFDFCEFNENGFSKNAVGKAENYFISFLQEDNEVYEFTKQAKQYIDKNIILLKINSDKISESNIEYIKLIDFLLEKNIPYEISFLKNPLFLKN